MKKNILDLTIEEFVRVLCDMEKEYTIIMAPFPKEPNEDQEVEITGTYKQIHDFYIDLSIRHPDSKAVQDYLKKIENTLFDYNLAFSDLDIYDYLEENTKGFQGDRCIILLNEMEMWHSMYITEERIADVNKKIGEGWNEYKTQEITLGKKTYKGIDYEDAYRKIYGVAYDWFYNKACWMLKRKIEEIAPKNNNVSLPIELDTEQARKYFARAINVGYMQKEGNGYKWLFGGNRGQARLGYFCNKAFAVPRPINKLEEIFGVKKLSASITNADSEVKRVDVKKWRNEIDNKIFND